VPNFRKTAFALSDIELYVPTVSPAMAGGLSDVLLAPASARRSFSRGERATAFLRLYQASSAAPVRVSISASIVDDHNRKRYGQDTAFEAAAFAATGAADYVVDLPLGELAPGEYLLSIDAKAASADVQRQVRFAIK
jgi:hypothetical protein